MLQILQRKHIFVKPSFNLILLLLPSFPIHLESRRRRPRCQQPTQIDEDAPRKNFLFRNRAEIIRGENLENVCVSPFLAVIAKVSFVPKSKARRPSCQTRSGKEQKLFLGKERFHNKYWRETEGKNKGRKNPRNSLISGNLFFFNPSFLGQ